MRNHGLWCNGTIFLNKSLIKSMVWQNVRLLFDAIDSEKYIGYAICQA